MHANLKRGLSRGALDVDAKTWPGLAELSFLRTIGLIWPTSDMNHVVISPTRLLMGAYLGLGRVRSLCDIASGLFLCTLFLQFEERSRRLVPEAVNFLINTVLHLAPHGYKDVASLPGSFPSPDFQSDLCSPLSIDAKKARNLTALKPNLVDILSEGNLNEQAKVDVLGLAVDLLGRFADMYKSLEGFIELYEPLYEVLLRIDRKKLSGSLQVSFQAALLSSNFNRVQNCSIVLMHRRRRLPVCSNFQDSRADPFNSKPISRSQSRPIFLSLKCQNLHTFGIKTLITTERRHLSFVIRLDRKGRVLSGNFVRMLGFLLLSNRRSRRRRIRSITLV